MNQKHDLTSRRILTFPAILPSDSVPPATLVASLINLATKICSYESENFSTNKQNIQRSIRLIKILLIFLEELRDRKPYFSPSITRSLSELHVSLQKIQFLLEDCTRDGARLWLLMKSERLSGNFRCFVRSIARALDVLSLDSIDVSIEVKEIVELVKRQARRVRFEVELDDQLALIKVKCALNMFDEMFVPNFDDMEQVLDHIGVSKWSECNQEVKFLNMEIMIEIAASAERANLMFLSSLVGFMIYSRCIMFDSIDQYATTMRHSKNVGISEVVNCLNRDDFRCPISLEFMVDPVTIATGHTYDRSSIQKWLKSENPICPTTGEKLKSKEFVPNLALQKLIRQYCYENSISMAEIESGSHSRNAARTPILASSAAFESAMKMVASFITERLENGTIDQKNKAAYEIRLLSKTSVFNRSCLVEAGTIPHLIMLLSSTDAIPQENAMAALLNLSKYPKSKTIIVQNNGVLLILDVLKMGLRMEAKQHAAAVLFYLSTVEEYRILIGENPETIPSLIDLIKTGTNHAKKNALSTILGLLMYQNHHWRVLASGAVPLLTNMLKSSETEDLTTDCLAILANLADNPDGTIAILRRGGLNITLEILTSSSSKTEKEFSVTLLLALCINGGGDVVSVLLKNQSLIGSLYTLLTEGTSRASKKATSIIKILHDFNERSSSSGSKNMIFPRERFVHAS